MSGKTEVLVVHSVLAYFVRLTRTSSTSSSRTSYICTVFMMRFCVMFSSVIQQFVLADYRRLSMMAAAFPVAFHCSIFSVWLYLFISV